MDYNEGDKVKVLTGKYAECEGRVSGLHLKDISVDFGDEGGSFRYSNVELVEKGTLFSVGEKVKRYVMVSGEYCHIEGDLPTIEEILLDDGILFVKDESVGYDLGGHTYRKEEQFGSYLEKI